MFDPKLKPKATATTYTCIHDSCKSCKGTGVKEDGRSCVHMIVCKCKKCTPIYKRI